MSVQDYSQFDEDELKKIFVEKTLYLEDDTKHDFEFWLDRIENENRWLNNFKRSRSIEYEAAIQVVMQHEEEFVNLVKQMAGHDSP